MHDGSRLLLRKLSRDYDPTNRLRAIQMLHESAAAESEVLTGILYVDGSHPTFCDTLNLPDVPLSRLDESKVRPSREVLEQIVEEFR
jgi:2-oxoglutarate ferredoxin oxidoreductase subunit beta